MSATSSLIMEALSRKYRTAAIVPEVVVRDPFEDGYRVRADIDRLHRDGHPRAEFWAADRIERAERRGTTVPDTIPEGWEWRGSIPFRRIDALMFEGSGVRTAVEVKTTRADFRRESEAKRRAWRHYTDRFVYVAPAGVIPRDELADGCGLWEFDADRFDPDGPWYGPHGLTSVVKCKRNQDPAPLPYQVTVALAYRAGRKEGGGAA